jgi:hypothetical protein
MKNYKPKTDTALLTNRRDRFQPTEKTALGMG